MGIARFYRYLSERYPLINERINAEELPEFDTLYLDMNGIIHNCSHGNSECLQYNDEEDVWVTIFEYINRLFLLIKPRKLLYMAVDGVAPRAKMNQQRSRRFRAAEDARQGRLESQRHGVESTLPPFDSNCITPGTEFMARLTEHLTFFIAMKMDEDPLWKRCQIILSGPEVPGEGEHKIMDFIRQRKAQPDYDPNLKHCLYGLDADLIMLALASHEPNFSLLREEVKFGRNQIEDVEARLMVNRDKFQLLHICLVREYLDFEFRDAAKNRPYTFDLERVIDDFILFCVLVGNDFLPHLPMAEISSNGLGILYEGYKNHLEHCAAPEPWISQNCGEINWPRLREFFTTIVEEENSSLQEKIDRGDYYLGGKRFVGTEPGEEKPDVMPNTNPVDTIEEARHRYYEMKLGIDINTQEGHAARNTLMQSYCEGMQWVLWYYYRGPDVASWRWFFPYHYTPFIFDLCYFRDIENPPLKLPQGGPVMAFEQLMSVLPAASSALVPECYRWFFHSENSPVVQYYPKTFAIDIDGVRVSWGGVTLIPFIDPDVLRRSLDEIEDTTRLSKEEKKRNTRSEAVLFEHDPEHQLLVPCALSRFKGIRARVRCSEYVHPDFPPGVTHYPNIVPKKWEKTEDLPTLFQFGKRPEVHLGRGVAVFGTRSRNESLIITIRPALPITDVDNALRDAQTVSVNFPTQAQTGKVVRILTYIDNPTHFDDVHSKLWGYRQIGLHVDCGTRERTAIPEQMPLCEVKLVKEPYLNDAGEVEYSLRDETELRLMPLVTRVDLRKTLHRRQVETSMTAMCLENGDARGLIGEIVKTEPLTARFMVKRALQNINAELSKIGRSGQRNLKWFTIQELAERAKIPEGVANQLVSSIWWKTPENVREDIGMNLKLWRNDADSMCCMNYATIITNVGWKFSSYAVDAVIDYTTKFPRLVEVLKYHNPGRDLYTKNLFPIDQGGNSFRLMHYIRAQPYKQLKLVPARYMALTQEALDAVRNEVDKRLADTSEYEVLSSEVYVPAARRLFPAKQFQEKCQLTLGMRVCYTKQDGPVGFGKPGTIIGAYEGKRPMCDVLLDEEFFGAGTCQKRCPPQRGLTCDQSDIIRLGNPNPVAPTATIVPQPRCSPPPLLPPSAAVPDDTTLSQGKKDVAIRSQQEPERKTVAQGKKDSNANSKQEAKDTKDSPGSSTRALGRQMAEQQLNGKKDSLNNSDKREVKGKKDSPNNSDKREVKGKKDSLNISDKREVKGKKDSPNNSVKGEVKGKKDSPNNSVKGEVKGTKDSPNSDKREVKGKKDSPDSDKQKMEGKKDSPNSAKWEIKGKKDSPNSDKREVKGKKDSPKSSKRDFEGRAQGKKGSAGSSNRDLESKMAQKLSAENVESGSSKPLLELDFAHQQPPGKPRSPSHTRPFLEPEAELSQSKIGTVPVTNTRASLWLSESLLLCSGPSSDGNGNGPSRKEPGKRLAHRKLPSAKDSSNQYPTATAAASTSNRVPSAPSAGALEISYLEPESKMSEKRNKPFLEPEGSMSSKMPHVSNTSSHVLQASDLPWEQQIAAHPSAASHGRLPWDRSTAAATGGSEIMALLHASKAGDFSSSARGAHNPILDIIKNPTTWDVPLSDIHVDRSAHVGATHESASPTMPSRAKFAADLPGEQPQQAEAKSAIAPPPGLSLAQCEDQAQLANASASAKQSAKTKARAKIKTTTTDQQEPGHDILKMLAGREINAQTSVIPNSAESATNMMPLDHKPNPLEVPLPKFVRHPMAIQPRPTGFTAFAPTERLQ